MSANEETQGKKGMECCTSFLGQCFGSGTEGKKEGGFDFKNCEQMMRQFCADKDGRFDPEACRTRMSQWFQQMSQAKCCAPGKF